MDQSTVKLAAEAVAALLLAALVTFDLRTAAPRRQRAALGLLCGLLMVGFFGLVGKLFLLVAG